LFHRQRRVRLSGNLKGFGYVDGVGPAPPDEPRQNYTEDPCFTDGLRVVLLLDEQHVPVDRLDMLSWESPVEGARDEPGAKR
jgi:hypothetical protein